MSDTPESPWWVEVIKASPGLAAVALAASLIVCYRKEIRMLFGRMTKVSGFGVEAEFSAQALDGAITLQSVQVSAGEKARALARLHALAPLLRFRRILWIDDNPPSTRHERAVLESIGVHVVTATTTAAAESELQTNDYLLVITDLDREEDRMAGLKFVARSATQNYHRPTIAYVGTNQQGLPKPAHLFGITNRPDELIHLVCDVVEREILETK